MLIKTKTRVEKLTERVENFYDQKQYYEDKQAQWDARAKEIRQAPYWTKTDFWCKRHGDTSGIAFKVVFKSLGDLCAYYESIKTGNYHPKDLACCKGLRRRITDKSFDPYFTDSEMLKRQRIDALENGDLLQPGQDGFVTKYGDSIYRKEWQRREREERANYERNHQ